MRSSMKILVAAAATLLVAPQFAMADDIENQLRQMDERMGQLESQLQATQDELEASKSKVAVQQELIEKAGLQREAQSGLSAFLSQTQFDGFVAVSYNYNFIGPDQTRQGKFAGTDGGTTGSNGYYTYAGYPIFDPLTLGAGKLNGGALGLTAPYHPNHNTFQVDQAWFGMRKPATAESRGGWGVDLVWGVAADNQGTPASINSWFGDLSEDVDSNGDIGGNAFGTGDIPHLYQAYVEYLAPIADTMIKVGRFKTLIGAETFRQDQNYNVTRGLLFALQPVNHTGVLIGGNYDSGLTWTVGLANSYSATMADTDNEKTFLGQAGYRGESFSFLVNGLYGGNPSDLPLGMDCSRFFAALPPNSCEGNDSDSVALLDLVGTWDPTESLSTWINFDYYWFTNAGNIPTIYDFDRMNIYGISAGAHWAFLENTGAAVRFEWLRSEYHPYVFVGTGTECCVNLGQDVDIFSLTGTLDHALTDNLSVRGEVRYDWAKDNTWPDEFFTTAAPLLGQFGAYRFPYTRDYQVLGIVEMMYRF